MRAGVLLPDADAFVERHNPNTNNGTFHLLLAKHAAPFSGTLRADRKILLRFDTSSLGTTAVNAQLSLSVRLTGADSTNVEGQTISFSVFGLNDTFNENWSETGITWNNAPANDTSSGDGVTSDAGFLGTFSVTGTGENEVVSFSSPLLDAFVNADTNDSITLIVTRNFFDSNGNGNIHAFASKEHANPDLRPTLTVSAVPEPSGLALYSLSVVLFFGWTRFRRKRLKLAA